MKLPLTVSAEDIRSGHHGRLGGSSPFFFSPSVVIEDLFHKAVLKAGAALG